MKVRREAISKLRHGNDYSVVCVGDVMLDRYVYGEAKRISPEAPVPVFLEGTCDTMLGGAGNVARNIAVYGGRVSLHVVTGDDTESERLHSVSVESKIAAHIHKDASRCTTTKTRFVAQGQQMLRCDRESLTPISSALSDQIFASVTAQLERASIVVLSDYLKGCLSSDLVAKIIAMSDELGLPVIVDPKGNDVAKYRGATIITPNEAEFRGLCGLECNTNQELVAASRTIIEEQEIKNVLITRGARGMLLTTPLETFVFPTVAKQVYDVSGAGDSVVAAMAMAMACGLSIPEACFLANIAGGIAVEKSGTSVVYIDELLSRVEMCDSESFVRNYVL